jgi:Protein of unknown function (DUF3800)
MPCAREGRRPLATEDQTGAPRRSPYFLREGSKPDGRDAPFSLLGGSVHESPFRRKLDALKIGCSSQLAHRINLLYLDAMTNSLPIACDEAGHTGPDLLHADQRFFAFGSVAIEDKEAWEIIQKGLRDHPVQMPELKAARLMRSNRGQALIAGLLEAMDGRFAVNVHNKLLALCGWVFEYIYEPVYKYDPRLLYEKNLHRFVAMFTYIWFNEAGGAGEQAVRQFQAYMRSRDEADAPLLFNRIVAPLGAGHDEHPFDLVLRFARGYRDVIIADNSDLNTVLPDAGRWTLDLSASALWSHLNHWGRQGPPLAVCCDVSKPLQAMAEKFTGDKNDPAIKRARLMGHKEPLGWKLSEPVKFVDSRDHPAVQLADVVAGVAVACLVNGVPEGFGDAFERLRRHLLPDTILPDEDIIDLDQRVPAVNYLMLYDLAERAERCGDPYANLAETYRAAEVSWARGDFKAVWDASKR